MELAGAYSSTVKLPAAVTDLTRGGVCLPVSGGKSGCQIFRLKSATFDGYLKYGSGALACDVVKEEARLRFLAEHVAVPRIVHFEASADEAWLATSKLAGVSAFDALRARPDDRLLIIDAMAGFLRQLHAIPATSCPFLSDHQSRMAEARQRIDQGLVECEDFDERHRGWSAERVWQQIVARLPLDMDRVVTHGDFTLDNVIIDGTELSGCIDVGRAGVADRHQDLALMWGYLEEFGDEARQRFLNSYGIQALNREKLLFHLELDEFF